MTETTYARRTLLASLVIVGMGFSVLFPILAPLGRELGLNEIQITAIISLSSLTVFLFSPIWGRHSDRVGRKRVILIGVFGFAAGTALFNSVLHVGLAGLLAGIPLLLALMIARAMHAAIMSAAMPAASAYMADVTTPAERTKGMGQVGAANNIGQIIGPSLSLLAVFSLMTPLWAIAVLSLINGLMIMKFLPESPHVATRAPSRRMRFTDPRILPFIIVGVSMFTGMALVQQTLGFRFQDVLELSAENTAIVFGFSMMFSAGASLFAQAVIVQRTELPPFTLLRLALPLLIVAYVLLAIVESQWMMYLAVTVLGLGMGMAGPAFMAGASLAVSPEEQGAVAGVAGACGPLGFTIGPLVGGVLYQIEGWLPYACAATMYVLLVFFMGTLGRRIKREGS